MDIESSVKKIISEQLGAKLEDIKSDSSIIDDLGADSLDTVELVRAFKEKSKLGVPDDEAEALFLDFSSQILPPQRPDF